MLRLLPVLAALMVVAAAATAATSPAGAPQSRAPLPWPASGPAAPAARRPASSSSTPTGAFALTDTDQKLSQQSPSAVLGGRTVTINYHVEAARKGKAIAVCYGSAAFTARRR